MLIFITYIFASIFLLAFVTQQIYFWAIFGKLSFNKKQKVIAQPMPISVVICAKNEAQNLYNNLPLIFAQDFPQFQVVVVNDCSSDETSDILEEFEKKHKNLHVVTLKEDVIRDHYKKLALTIGIKGAHYDHMIFTDADCIPRSNQWLKTMAANYTPEKQIVIGYGAYKKTNGLLNKIIRYDCFYGALQYFSFALIGKPYMGVGRNLGYRKNFFFENKGFSKHYHIQSGEDDLFVNANTHDNNYALEFSPDSHTETEAKKTYKKWKIQKMRHLSTSKFYKASDRFRIGLLAASQYFFIVGLIAMISLSLLNINIVPFQIYIVASVALVRYITLYIVMFFAMKKLCEKDLLLLTPLFELIMLWIYPIWHFKNMFVKRHQWK